MCTNILLVQLMMLSAYIAHCQAQVQLATVLTQQQRFYIPDTGTSGAENLAVDTDNKLIFVADGSNVAINVLDLTTGKFVTAIAFDSLFAGIANITDVTSVQYNAESEYIVAAAIPSAFATEPGYLVFIDSPSLQLIHIMRLESCFLPDHVEVSPDGETIVVACEGEPNDNEVEFPASNPTGSVAVVDVDSSKSSKWSYKIADFTAFDDVAFQPLVDQLYISYQSEPFSVNVEPEYVAIDSKGKYAYITLQEQNGVAVLDVKKETIIDIFPLGFNDFSQVGLDASDKDKSIRIESYPNLKGLRAPDNIAYFKSRSKRQYIITANEGDTKKFDEVRVADVVLSDTAFAGIDTVSLQMPEVLGRLKVSNLYGKNSDGEYETLYAFSSRDITIYEIITGKEKVPIGIQLVYSSDDLFERVTSEILGIDGFNSNYFSPSFDARSDDKGPEVESVVVGECDNKRMYAFAAMERAGGVFVFDITDVDDNGTVRYVQYLNEQNYAVSFEEDTRAPESAGDIGPEQMRFIPQKKIDEHAYLMVAYTESASVTVYKVDCDVPLQAAAYDTRAAAALANDRAAQSTPVAHGVASQPTTNGIWIVGGVVALTVMASLVLRQVYHKWYTKRSRCQFVPIKTQV